MYQKKCWENFFGAVIPKSIGFSSKFWPIKKVCAKKTNQNEAVKLKRAFFGSFFSEA